MSLSARGVVLLLGVAVCGAASADVHLSRRPDGSAVIFNDSIGSGWRVNGRSPTDLYLLTRKDASTPYDDVIRFHAGREGVDPKLVKSVMLIESNFNSRAVSRKGARGLMQLMPATARRFGVRDSFNPVQNIQGGVRYLASLLTMFRGNMVLALAAYNAGESAITRHGGVPPYPETQEYVRRAMVAYKGAWPRSTVVSGGFRGMDTSMVLPGSDPDLGATAFPAFEKPRKPGAPVRLRVDHGGGVLVSNLPATGRGGMPILGRVGRSGDDRRVE